MVIKGHSHIREARRGKAKFASPRACVYGVASTSGATVKKRYKIGIKNGIKDGIKTVER